MEQHSLFAELETRPAQKWEVALEMRVDSKVYVNDVNSDAALGYAAFNISRAHEFNWAGAAMLLYARVKNLFDGSDAGSVIVNDANSRFFEPAPGRHMFIGLGSKF